MFAWEHEGVAPDFLCLAKGLTGGTLPLAATLTSERVFDAFLGDYAELKTFFYGHSYCGNALACAAALASAEVFEREQTLDRLDPKIAAMRQLLASLAESPHVSETRQCGLIAGIELCRAPGRPYDWREATGARVCMAARPFGLLTRPILDTVVLMPPLCISEAELEEAVHAIRSAVDVVCRA
jgi:adenosylmethionine-8-amino-7-oxononanoate aminotransferase